MMTAKLLLAYLLQTVDVTGFGANIEKIDIDEAYCLAKNIYYESSGEGLQGQFAVAAVTLNRVEDPRYPSTICGVVKQVTITNITKKAVCQFSWYCEPGKRDKDIPIRKKDGSINQLVVDKFQIASMVAIAAMYGEVPDISKGATHFYNPKIVSPAWASELRKTRRIGNHDFHRLPPPKE